MSAVFLWVQGQEPTLSSRLQARSFALLGWGLIDLPLRVSNEARSPSRLFLPAPKREEPVRLSLRASSDLILNAPSKLARSLFRDGS